MTEQQTPEREKKIAEIREALRRVELGTYRITAFADLEYWLRFLLSELERLEREYAEERAAHNAHVAELCQLEEENRKLRERLKEEIVWQDECLKLEEQLQSAQQEIKRLEQERAELIEALRSIRNELDRLSRESRQKWKREGDMYEQGRADAYDEADILIRDILCCFCSHHRRRWIA